MTITSGLNTTHGLVPIVLHSHVHYPQLNLLNSLQDTCHLSDNDISLRRTRQVLQYLPIPRSLVSLDNVLTILLSPTMGAPDVQDLNVRAVASFNSLLKELLVEAAAIKPPSSDRASSIEPPLSKQDFPNISERVAASLSEITEGEEAEGDDAAKTSAKQRRFLVVEAVTRDTISRLIVRTHTLVSVVHCRPRAKTTRRQHRSQATSLSKFGNCST